MSQLQDKKFLFLGGNARSGTTALMRLLNCHPGILMLNERFLVPFQKGELRPENYDREPLVETVKKMAPGVLGSASGPPERWDRAEYLGDKLPPIFRGFELLDERFPQAEIIYILRNPFSVAASYRDRLRRQQEEKKKWQLDHHDGMKSWNLSVAKALERLEAGKRMMVVCFEDMFRSRDRIDAIYTRLGLDPSLADAERIDKDLSGAEKLNEKEEKRDEELRRFVAMKADFDSYRRLVNDHAMFRD